jgi:MFS family permease
MFKNLNKSILYLTLSDSFVWGPFIIIANLTSLYLSEKLGADIASFVGIGTGIYFLTRTVFQLPIGMLTDKIDNDRDEIILLTLGIVLMGLPFLFYPTITEPYQYYILQFIFGLGVSFNLPNWRKLFAINLKEGKEGSSYGFYETVLSFSTVIFSIVIGYVANLGDVYFDWVMRGVAILMMLAGSFALLIFTVDERKSHNGHSVLPVERIVK